MRLRKNKVICFLLVCLMCFAFSFTALASSEQGSGDQAENTNQTQAETEVKDSSRGLLESMLNVIFRSPTTSKDQEDPASILQPYAMLDESVVIVYRALEGIYSSTLYSVFIAIGVVLLTVYFLMDLSTRDILDNTGNKDTVEQLTKPFIKWILCIIFIMNIKWVLLMLLGLSQGAYNQATKADISIAFNDTNAFSSPDSGGELNTEQVIDEIFEMIGYEEINWASDEGFINSLKKDILGTIGNSGINVLNMSKQLPLMLAFFIPWLVSIVCDGLLVYVILSRIVNIAIQGAMAPIAMADAYSGNSNGSIRDTRAWAYIKNFASLCFQSVVISLTLIIVNAIIVVFISRIFGAMSNPLNTIGWWMNTAVQMTILKMVQVGTVMGSAQKAKELFNA